MQAFYPFIRRGKSSKSKGCGPPLGHRLADRVNFKGGHLAKPGDLVGWRRKGQEAPIKGAVSAVLVG